MDSVSFKARIRPVSTKEFTEIGADIYNKAAVNFPWTAKETIKGIKGLTNDVFDCTAGGIVNQDTKQVVLFHICPTQRENRYFDDIQKHILDMVGNGKQRLRGFLLGSQKMYHDSNMLMQRFQMMMGNNNIPTTIIKGTKEKTHIMYNGVKDEWLINSDKINNRLHQGKTDVAAILKECFEEVNIAKGDII